MNLLPTQRNQLHKAIGNSSFDHSDFELEEYTNGEVKIIFLPSEGDFYCELTLTNNPFKKNVEMSPGRKSSHENLNPKNWEEYLKYFNIWLVNLKREYAVPNLWDLVSSNILEANSELKTVETQWNEINQGQEKLMEMFKSSEDSYDFQNIGNTSRKVLELLANQVFDPAIHIPEVDGIDLSDGKFKNQLHTFIRCELGSNSHEELRKYAMASIDAVEKAINLANSLTHKTSASKAIAEACIISVVSSISLIKMIVSIES